jgi:hypothetical protein
VALLLSPCSFVHGSTCYLLSLPGGSCLSFGQSRIKIRGENDFTLHGPLGCQISASTKTLVRWNWRATSIKCEADRVSMFVAASAVLWLLWLCSSCYGCALGVLLSLVILVLTDLF